MIRMLVFSAMVIGSAIFPLNAQSLWDQIPAKVKERKSYKRMEWFYRQRSAPQDTIPVEQWRRELKAAVENQEKQSASGLSWSPIGPAGLVSTWPSQWGVVGGRVRAVAVHPTDPQTLYIGAAGGGLWKSTNGGGNWSDVGHDLTSQTYGAIAIDPADPQTVYAGAGEAIRFFNLVIYEGDGLFKSTDGGASWAQISDGFGSRTHWSALKVSPHNSSVVFATLASGNWLYQSPGNEGVWRSTNGGQNWVRTLNVNDAFDVLPHPSNPSKVFAAIGGASAAAGFYISTNNGLTWTQSNTGLTGASNIDRMQIAMSPSDTSTVYALICATLDSIWLYKSTNGGSNWFRKAGYSDSQGWYDLLLGVNPNDVNEVYIGNNELRRSTNGGTTFSYVGGSYWNQAMHVDFHTMAFAPSDPTVRYVGCDGGVYRSTNGGTSWQSRNAGLTTIQYYRLSSHPTDANIVLGGAQDNGVYMTTNGGVGTWDLVSTGDGMESFIDPIDPNNVYISTQNGSLAKSLTGGFYGSYFGISPNYGSESVAWTAPFFMHPTNPEILYAASSRPYKSTDGGNSWAPLASAFSSTAINSMAQSPVNPDNMIAVSGEYSNSPAIRVSTNGGSNWYVTAVPGAARYVSRVVAHSRDASTMFVVRSGYGSGKVYRSTNMGASWSDLSGNLPDVPANDLFIDPENPHHWYLANDLGVYFTSNGGSSWTRESALPFVPGMDFSYFNDGATRLLRVGTHGRSAYQAPLPAGTSLTLTFPNGGDNLVAGSTANVTWTTAGTVSHVRVEYSTNGGTGWITAATDIPNTGTYAWNVPVTATTQGRVRVADASNSALFDQSESLFSITTATYVVKYEETFASGTPPAGWFVVNNDGSAGSTYLDYRDRVAFQSGDTVYPQAGQRFWFSSFNNANGNGLIDEWLISPRLNGIIANDSLYFWAGAIGGAYHDSLRVLVSTTDSLLPSFVNQIGYFKVDGPIESWHPYGFSLTPFAGSNIFVGVNYFIVDGGPSGNHSDNVWIDHFVIRGPSVTDVTMTDIQAPKAFVLEQNHPNPFNPTTTLRYGIAQGTLVELVIYNALGQKVRTLVNEKRGPGVYTVVWDGKNANGSQVGSGIYIARLKAGTFVQSRKMMFLK